MTKEQQVNSIIRDKKMWWADSRGGQFLTVWANDQTHCHAELALKIFETHDPNL